MSRILFSVTFLFFFGGQSVFAQVSQVQGSFLPGHYYPKEGQRQLGWVRHTFGGSWGDTPDNFIDFKSSPDAQEAVRLTVQEISSFVIGQDSFVVKQNFDINNHDHYTQDFMRVVKSGRLSLYLHYSTIYTRLRKNILTYFVEKDGELYRMSRPENFTEQFPFLITDNKALLHKVKNKEYKFSDLQTAIDEYNQWHAQQSAK
ncbi:MAG: hypothetical protein ACO1OQ_15565 [Rufibacter sp.]